MGQRFLEQAGRNDRDSRATGTDALHRQRPDVQSIHLVLLPRPLRGRRRHLSLVAMGLEALRAVRRRSVEDADISRAVRAELKREGVTHSAEASVEAVTPSGQTTALKSRPATKFASGFATISLASSTARLRP